jgi:hypothetical protein
VADRLMKVLWGVGSLCYRVGAHRLGDRLWSAGHAVADVARVEHEEEGGWPEADEMPHTPLDPKHYRAGAKMGRRSQGGKRE